MSIPAADRAAVARFVRACGSGVVATIGDDGAPQAAFVGFTATDEGVLVFDAPASSRKVHNIAQRSQIAVAVTGADVTVQFEGSARVTHDEERWRLGETYSERFPGSRAMDAGFVVVAVQARWVRVYDAGTHPPTVSEAQWDADAAPSDAGHTMAV